MSVEPFKVMVMDDVARTRQSLIAFLQASGSAHAFSYQTNLWIRSGFQQPAR
jgi:hypothetical protein